jgi:hypothetical protein
VLPVEVCLAYVHRARIQADVESGIASGVHGTPTYLADGVRHGGSYDEETLLAAPTGG